MYIKNVSNEPEQKKYDLLYLEQRKKQKRKMVYRTNLEDVVSRFHICDVDPLAVDVCVIGVVTSRAQTLQMSETFMIYFMALSKMK